MEFIPSLKNNSAVQKLPIVVLLTAATTLIILSIFPLVHYPSRIYPSTLILKTTTTTTTTTTSDQSSATRAALRSRLVEERLIRVAQDEEEGRTCNIFAGEWVPNPEAPYYTNTTCWAIHEHQNCMKYGRPDDGFMKWRWKPDGCELPIFNPYQFLDMMRGKSMAFVGDSVGRNHMQSLVCLLSRVESPVDDSGMDEADVDDYYRRWKYPSYNFTLAAFWSTYLIKSQQADATGNLFNLQLDELDEKWSSKIHEFDYVIINTGQWFFRPTIYYENNRIVGCHGCQLQNVPDLPITFAFRKAWKTAFKAIKGVKNYKSVTLVRTYAPSHFEGGEWNKGGNCIRKKPFKNNETTLDGTNLELYLTQLEEFRIAELGGKQEGLRFRLLDITQAMLLRPDGHPSKYGHWPNANVTLYNDCVHWCLPGPIDSWNDFLLQMLKMEGRRSYEEKLQPKRKERRLISH